jgi:hypothetical protein
LDSITSLEADKGGRMQECQFRRRTTLVPAIRRHTCARGSRKREGKEIARALHESPILIVGDWKPEKISGDELTKPKNQTQTKAMRNTKRFVRDFDVRPLSASMNN